MPMNNDENLVASIESGCQSWRQGDDQDGSNAFKRACLLWLDRIELDRQSDEARGLAGMAPLVTYMQKLLDALHANDIIMAADILEYDVLPLLKDLT